MVSLVVFNIGMYNCRIGYTDMNNNDRYSCTVNISIPNKGCNITGIMY